MIAKLLMLIVILLICLFMRFPIFMALLISALSFSVVFPEIMAVEIVAQGFLSGLSSTSLAGIAFFFLAGEIMVAGGIADKIIQLLRACIGHVRGGLSHINVIESVIFAGVSGSAMADTAAMSNLLIPAMKKNGYPAEYATAITLATSAIGPIIPPSTGLVLLAIYNGANVSRVLMGGLVPGLAMGGFMLVASLIICKRRNYPKDEWLGFKHLLRTVRDTIFAILMPVLIIYCLSAGIGTVNEVGAATCFYCILVSMVIYRDLNLRGLWDAILSSAKTIGRILSINAACGVFNWIVASLGMRTKLVELMSPFIDRPHTLMFLVLAIFLVGGCFMAQSVMLYIVTPLMCPVIIAAGIDVTMYCVFAMIACTLGLITPPVGTLIYMGSSIAKVSPTKVVRELVPFIIAIVATLIVMIYVPELATAFPNFLYG